jgi:hypothetical protein
VPPWVVFMPSMAHLIHSFYGTTFRPFPDSIRGLARGRSISGGCSPKPGLSPIYTE